MHVLDLLIGKKHGHKVSFDKNHEDESQQNEQQQRASTGASSSKAAPAAQALPGASDAALHKQLQAQIQSHMQNQHPQQQLQQPAGQQQPAQQQQDPGDPHKLKQELKKLLRRAAVSFRDLNISVHEASHSSLAQLHDTAGATGAAAHSATAPGLTASRHRVAVEQKKLAIIMVSRGCPIHPLTAAGVCAKTPRTDRVVQQPHVSLTAKPHVGAGSSAGREHSKGTRQLKIRCCIDAAMCTCTAAAPAAHIACNAHHAWAHCIRAGQCYKMTTLVHQQHQP